MNREEWASLAADAERVRDALATVKWLFRGVVVGADTPTQASVAEAALRIVERAETTADVVAGELGRIRDVACAPEKGGDR